MASEPLTGVELIAIERKRHVEVEGYSADHDSIHRSGELARAAACYATPPMWRWRAGVGGEAPINWPSSWTWKPGPRVRELVKAGALIAAEIDRLQKWEIDRLQGRQEDDGAVVPRP